MSVMSDRRHKARTVEHRWSRPLTLLSSLSVAASLSQDENPLPKAAQIAKDYNFQTPLDEVDAAMRVLDPILAPLAELQEHAKAGKKPPLDLKKMKIPFGYFIKDYMKCEW